VLLVLWDIDGTLVDAARHGRYAFAEAFEAVTGRPAGEVSMAGSTDRQIALAMLDGADHLLPDVLDGLITALERREEDIRRDGRALPGVEEVLRRLDGTDGVVQSLLTGNLAANAAVKLGAFGLERWLDLEVGGYGSDPHDARSDLVRVARERAAAKYGRADDTVLVGDTPLDVKAGHDAGARVVAVASGPYGTAELEQAGADVVLADLADAETAIAAVTAST
jgi:phosphoglycolate phosphatase-like HAD superfamily hydrolase